MYRGKLCPNGGSVRGRDGSGGECVGRITLDNSGSSESIARDRSSWVPDPAGEGS